MRPKPDADPKLLSRPKSRPWHRSLSSLTRHMTLVALSGLALAAYTERSRPKPSRLAVRNLMLRQQSPGFLQQSPVPSSVDPSISITPARKFRMLLHTNPTRERGECLGTAPGASEDM